MKLITIVHELRKTSGLLKKLEILKQHEDNKQWIKCLQYMYNPHVSYGISPPKLFDFDSVNIDEQMFETFDQLNKRELTGGAAKEAAKQLSTKYGEIPRLILGKSLKSGISSTTINKAYPGLIDIFLSMKGKDVNIIEYPVWTSIKFDGVKVFVTKKNNEVSLTTSSGLPFKLSSLEQQFKNVPEGVYEGELTYKEGKIIHRPIITGMLNSLIAGTKSDLSDYTFRIYDMISLDEWNSQVGTTIWWHRQDVLSGLTDLVKSSTNMNIIDHTVHNSENEVVSMFEELTAQGYEGTMSRYESDTYQWKRVERLVKKKSINECVLVCIGTTSHSNPARGITGSLQLSGIVNDKVKGTVEVKVSTGSGLSKFDILCEADRYIGKEIEILYNSVTKTNKGYSLFLPRFKRIINTTKSIT